MIQVKKIDNLNVLFLYVVSTYFMGMFHFSDGKNQWLQVFVVVVQLLSMSNTLGLPFALNLSQHQGLFR